MRVEDIAKCCHELNRSFCKAVGDFSQKSWEEAEEWQRESAIKGVQFCIDNPEICDSALHDAWCFDKFQAGWVYGPEKNAELKTHLCLIPFQALPIEQQLKDVLFQNVCRKLIPLLD